jgi:large subunit ribosomal protein L10
MPSTSILESKKAKVEALAAQIKESASFVLVDYSGINVEDDTKLRRDLRDAGVNYTVEKNSIIRFALHEAGYEQFDEVLHGATAIALSNDDQTAPARVLGEFAKDKEDYFNLKAGCVEGEYYDAAGVEKLSKIPSKDVLLAQLVGSLQGPLQKLAATLQAVADSKSEDTAA